MKPDRKGILIMKKELIRGLVIGVTGLCLTGCGNAIPEMTTQQQELVVEYAVSELLKYDKNHETKLVVLDVDQEAAGAVSNVASSELTDEIPKEESESSTKVEEGISKDDVTVIDQTENVNISMEEFLKLNNVEITYTGYETADAYPPESQDEIYFYMSATEGNKLLVLKFDVKNVSAQDMELDMAGSQTRYKIVVNNEEKNALTTLLLNDMAYYKGTLAAGESVELVVVGEIPQEQEAQITSLELIMKNVDDTATISLN